jgi:F-type H+-transporting ATPase subunit c
MTFFSHGVLLLLSGAPPGGGAGIGVGMIFSQFLNGALRNPSASQGQFANLIFGFAVTEALGIFSLLVALLLLFAV